MQRRESEPHVELDELTRQMIRVGMALSSTRDLQDLLELVLSEARKMTLADAGSIYLLEGGNLVFETSQNMTLAKRLGEEAAKALFKRRVLPLNSLSIAGHAALSKQILYINEVNDIPSEYEYKFNPEWDKANNYTSRSMLVLPIIDGNNKVVGVIQLINAMSGPGEDAEVVPFNRGVEPVLAAFASQAAVAINNAKLNKQVHDAYLDSLFRLSVAAEFRDKETSNHIRRVSEFCKLLGQYAGMDNDSCQELFWASAMHDVGKLGIPDAILQKPGPLDPGERRIMECHCIIGSMILKGGASELIRMAQVVSLTHHERWDGTGYPRKLKGEDIPLYGRITALADVFDALSSQRIYKPPFPLEMVLEIIKSERGKHFEPRLVDEFLNHIDEFMDIRESFLDQDSDLAGYRDYEAIQKIYS